MPKMLPVIGDNFRTDTPDSRHRHETRPLVINALESVRPCAESTLTSACDGRWQWLKGRLWADDPPPLPEKMALADVLKDEESHQEFAGDASRARGNAQSRPWLYAGVALTLIGAAGALAWGLSRRAGNDQAEEGGITGNISDSSATQPAELAMAQALELVGYAAPVLTSRSAVEQASAALGNTTRDSLLARFPGIGAAPVEQLLINPLLEKLTASFNGREMNRDELEQQLTRLINVTLSTLNVREHLQLYRHDRSLQDNQPFASRFTIYNGRGHVPLNQHTYPLRITPEGIPFITTMDGRCHFIRYNQRTSSWEYVSEVDDQGYSKQARHFNHKYRLRPVNLPAGTRMNYHPKQDCAGITSSGWINTWGVFIAGNFIPVWMPPDVSSEAYTNIDCDGRWDKHLLVRGDYGWEFERPSVSMDSYLKALLESKKTGVDNDFIKIIGRIRETEGVAVDRAGQRWLKKDNQYFPVERHYDAGTISYLLKLTGHTDAWAEYKNGVVQLKRADEMLFPLETTLVKNSIIASRLFLIETAAAEYLRKNAAINAAKPTDLLAKYHPGLAEADDYSTMLVINNQKYTVREYADRYIRVENRENPLSRQQDIVLWPAGNTLLRVRESPADIAYTQLPVGYFAAPGENNRRSPVLMETSLYNQLQQIIQNDQIPQPAPSAEHLVLIEHQNVPIGWFDRQTHKTWFLYNGHYFPATFTDADNKDNPAGLTLIKVFARGDFFTQQKLIAELVIEEKADRIEIKNADSLLAEKLSISKNIATLYNEKRAWRNEPEMRIVEELVSESVANGKLRLPQLTRIIKNNKIWETEAQRRVIKKRLYPARVNEKDLEFIKFSAGNKLLIPGGQEMYTTLDNTFQLIKNTLLPVLDEAIHYDGESWPIIKAYLHKALGDIGEELLSDIAVAWSERLRFISAELSTDKVQLVYANGYVLKQRDIILGSRVFVSPDGNHIYINTQKINPHDPAQIRLVSELLPALASPANSGGNFLFIRQDNGMYLPVNDAREAVIASLKEGQFTPEQQRFLLAETKQYLQRLPAWRRHINMPLTPAKLAFLATWDPAYRAHLLLTSPAFVTLLSLDAFYLLARSEKSLISAAEWLRQYGELRASVGNILIEEGAQDTSLKKVELAPASSSTTTTQRTTATKPSTTPTTRSTTTIKPTTASTTTTTKATTASTRQSTTTTEATTSSTTTTKPTTSSTTQSTTTTKPTTASTTTTTNKSSTTSTVSTTTRAGDSEQPHLPHKHDQQGKKSEKPEDEENKEQQKEPEQEVDDDVRSHSGQVEEPGSQEVEAPPEESESIEIDDVEEAREAEEDESGSVNETEFGSVEESDDEFEDAEEVFEDAQESPRGGPKSAPRPLPPAGVDDEVIIRPIRLPRLPVPPVLPVPPLGAPVPLPGVPRVPAPGRLPPLAEPVERGASAVKKGAAIVAAGGGVAGAAVGIGAAINAGQEDEGNSTITAQPERGTGNTTAQPERETDTTAHEPPITLPTTLATQLPSGNKTFPDPEELEKYHKAKIPPAGPTNETVTEPDIPYVAPDETVQKVFIPGRGNVTVITIPGLECLGEKEVPASEIVRLVGKALQRPAVANALAKQEDTHLDLYGTCPPAEAVEKLDREYDVLDALINTVLMHPKMWSVFVLKNVVGPIVEMAADDMEGKEIAISDRIYLILNAVMQGLSLFTGGKVSIKKPGGSAPAKPAIPVKPQKSSEFKSKGDLMVRLDGKDYPLEMTYDEKLMVNDNGHRRFIHYNQLEDHWDFNQNIEYFVAEEAERNQYKYRKVFNDLVEEPTIVNDDNDILTLDIKNHPQTTGVFIGANFIPARAEKIGDEVVAYTTIETVPAEEQRVLVKDKYGWRFERGSVKKEDNLELLLTNNEEHGINIAKRSIGSIHESDGLCYDTSGEAYIKHNYKYFRAEKINSDKAENKLKLVDYKNAIVSFSKGYFTLDSADDFLFVTKTEKMQYRGEAYRVEKSAMDYLRKHAQETSDTYPIRVDTGIYQDATGTQKVLATTIEKYIIDDYSARQIKIKPNDGQSSPIVLWKDRNTWFRVREQSDTKPDEYTDISLCRVARSPGSSPCTKISMETTLQSKLLQETHDEDSSVIVPDREKLTEIRKEDIPFLYTDSSTGKKYFQFGDKYFNARIIEADSPDNPTGHLCLKVTGRSDFYRSEKKIETIVIIDEGNVSKMVGLSTFVAKNLGISRGEAIKYLKKIPYNNIESIETLEKLTKDALIAEKMYVEQPANTGTPVKSRIPMRQLLLDAKKTLFPEHVAAGRHNEIYSYDLDSAVVSSYALVKDTGEFVSQQINYINKEVLTKVINAFDAGNYNHPIVEDYLIEILKKEDNNFISDVERSFSFRLQGAKEDLAKRQIKLLTTYANPDDMSVLTGKNTEQLIFIHENDSGNVFINMDELTQKELTRSRSRDAFTSVLLKELLRSSGQASHIVDLQTKNGIFVNVKNAYKYIQTAAKNEKFEESTTTKMSKVISSYLENSPVYKEHLELLADMPKDSRKFGYMLRYDPGFRAHVTLNSDNFMTLITQDLHFLIASSEQEVSIMHPWVKKYGLLREAIRDIPDVNEIESVINSRTEIAHLAKVTDSYDIVGPDPAHKNMFLTQQHSRCLRWQGNYYPVEFLGKSGRVIVVGTPQEMRQIYYYVPQQGSVFPIQPRTARMNVLSYHSDLDVYERRDPSSDFTEIAKYDAGKQVLVPTGASRIFHLPGKVTRIEFPWFNLYHPQGASLDIYIAAHGKMMPTEGAVPGNSRLLFYIEKGQQLVPYKGNVEDLLSATFTPKQIIDAGDSVENYVIKPFTREPVNSLYLAHKYNKNIVQIISRSTPLSSVTESLSTFFMDDKINIHLYTCRALERPNILDAAGESSIVPIEANIDPETANINRRWGFDQQVESGELINGQTMTGFLPLRETPVFLHYGTIEAQLKDIIAYGFQDVPYDIYYGLDISSYSTRRIPQYLIEPRVQLRSNISKAKQTLETALLKLNDEDYDLAVRKYLDEAFENYDYGDIAEEVVKRLKINISRAREFIEESSQTNYNNIALVSSRQIANPDVPGSYRSVVPETVRARLPKIFTLPGDAFRRIFFVNDAMTPLEAEGRPVDPQQHVFIHESSHITGKTYDIFYCHTDTNLPPKLGEPGDSLKRLNEILDKGQIRGTPLWLDFMPLYYRQFGIKEPMKEDAVVKLIKESPMLKANIIMENADSFAIFAQDIANLQKAGHQQKRETVKPEDWSDYQYLGMIFTATREHYLNNEV